MKLSDLRGSIRKASGNPSMVVDLGNGVPLTVTFQKTPLLEELGRVFNGERTAETGLSFDPESGTILFMERVNHHPLNATMGAPADLDAVRDQVHGLADEVESGDDFDAVQDAVYGADDEDDLL